MLIRSTVLYAPAMAAPRLAAFLLIIYLTRRLGPGEFGLFSLVTVLGEILDMSASNWVRFSLLRSDTLRPSTWRNAFCKCAWLLAGTTALACSIAVVSSFGVAREKPVGFALGVSAYIISNSFLRFGLTALQMQERRLEYSLIEILRSCGILASAWLSTRGSSPGFVLVVLANASVTGAFAAYACLRGFVNMPRGSDAAAGYRARMLYGLPIVALQLVQYTVASSDRIVLKLLAGAASVGIYAAGYSLARVPIDIVGNAVNQGAFPHFMRVYDEKGPEEAARFVENAFELLTLLLLAVLGVSTGISGILAHTLLPAKYHDVATVIIPLIGVGAVFMGIKSYVFDNIFHAARKNWLQVATYGPAGATTLALCFILIPILGRPGAAAAFAAGAAVGLGVSYLVTRNLIHPRLRWRELVKAAAAAAAAGLAARYSALAADHLPGVVGLFLALSAGLLAWTILVLVFRVDLAWRTLGRAFERLQPAA